MKPIINIKKLSVSFETDSQKTTVVKAISFDINENEIVGIVGESGSGKSITSLALMGLLPHNALVEGEILFENVSLHKKSNQAWRKIRGHQIAMIFQEPMSSLNPSLSCGFQVKEMILQHQNISDAAAKKCVIELFEQVKLPRVSSLYNQYPHQISGGQKQRVMIAMAIANQPKLLIADEPTTALDVTVQQRIIDLLKELQAQNGMSILFISHDLTLISEIAQRVLVMKDGEIVEQGTVNEVFKHPKHPYTKALINSKPKLNERLKILPTVQNFLKNDFLPEVITKENRQKKQEQLYAQTPLLSIKNLKKYYKIDKGWFQPHDIVKAVDDIDLNIYEGETVGLVGESGCGKTTLGRTILNLEKPTAGELFYKGIDITTLKDSDWKVLRKEIQLIFQDPYASLNPRITIGKAILEPMKVHQIHKSDKERKLAVVELLKKVGLNETHYSRYPHEFSGGQRQRIGIARAIALHPKLIICDESVSALDVSVQAQVLNLLNQLKDEFQFTYLFISHDLAVVKYMSDQMVVMHQGKIVEKGEADGIYEDPQNEYTKKLINSIPKGI
ncbi:MAG: ABC transporter ATP-binding protein [Flavobacteriaceae bacterium]|nr:ABC transporter ATP-binding protein [Flavobacteriaceae bacterium]